MNTQFGSVKKKVLPVSQYFILMQHLIPFALCTFFHKWKSINGNFKIPIRKINTLYGF